MSMTYHLINIVFLQSAVDVLCVLVEQGNVLP